MKTLLLLGLLVGATRALAQQPAATSPGPAVTVEVSRTHCLVRFVQMLAGNGYGGSRRAFERSRFNTPEARRWLRRYGQLDAAPDYRRQDYPPDRIGSYASTEPVYLAAAADAASPAELPRRVAGLLPNEVLVSLDSVYRYFEPAFEALAWQPHAAALEQQRAAYARFLAEQRLLSYFGRLRTFYGAVWPDALPYRVLLNPQLDTTKDFTNKATVVGNLVLLDCQPRSRDFQVGADIMFHEMAHSLSGQQRLRLQKQIEGWYLRNPSPSRRYAYSLMEEGLATAAGEWVHAQQTGQPETGSWYNDDYINRYAHALYPLLAGYVERGQPIDSLFVGQAIATFDRTFPQAGRDYGNLFRQVLYWTDADDFRAARRPFRERFNSTFTQSVSPIVGEEKPLSLIQEGKFFPVILVTKNHAATLRYLRQRLPALRAQRLPATQGFVLTATSPTGPLVLVNALNAGQLTAAAALLAQQKQLDPKTPLTLLSER